VLGLSRVALRGFDLSGFDLSRADLQGADLRGTNCSDANLAGAHLEGANLFQAASPALISPGPSSMTRKFPNYAQLVVPRNPGWTDRAQPAISARSGCPGLRPEHPDLG